jgi:prolipoprotein diacylglyceryl transferase
MFIFQNFSSIFIGPFRVTWYNVFYLLGWLFYSHLAQYRTKQRTNLTEEALWSLEYYLFLGIILGGRLGDIVFYHRKELLADPWLWYKQLDVYSTLYIVILCAILTAMLEIAEWIRCKQPIFLSRLLRNYLSLILLTIIPLIILIATNNIGGMSFHGSLLGALLVVGIYSYQCNQSFLNLLDCLVPCVPPALGMGRIGNFLNGELWGRPTVMPWGIIFPQVDFQPRHPSQLYECALEGILLFIILWGFSKKPKPQGVVTGLFGILYAVARISVECFREPNPSVGFIAWGWLTMGQLLCIPMLIVGIVLITRGYFSTG